MPETTAEPTALADLAARWERQSAEYLSDWQDYDSHDGQERRGQGIALGDAASELRAALTAAPAESDDAHTETVTQYRVTYPKYEDSDAFEDLESARHWVEKLGDKHARVEFRTVTTSRRESEWKATDQ